MHGHAQRHLHVDAGGAIVRTIGTVRNSYGARFECKRCGDGTYVFIAEQWKRTKKLMASLPRFEFRNLPTGMRNQITKLTRKR